MLVSWLPGPLGTPAAVEAPLGRGRGHRGRRQPRRARRGGRRQHSRRRLQQRQLHRFTWGATESGEKNIFTFFKRYIECGLQNLFAKE